MVGIVKWLRHMVVVHACVGSNPTTHPKRCRTGSALADVGASPSGKATDSDSVMRRFESCRPSQKKRRHSQVVRQSSAKALSPVQVRVSPPTDKRPANKASRLLISTEPSGQVIPLLQAGLLLRGFHYRGHARLRHQNHRPSQCHNRLPVRCRVRGHNRPET